MKRLSVPYSVDHFLESKLTGSVFTWRMIVSLLIPLILDSLFANLIAMLASALVSQNGEASVAAVSLVAPIVSTITNISVCIACGGGVVIAQCFGQDLSHRINKAVGMTIWISLATAAAIALPLMVFPRETLMLLYPEAEPIVMDKACIYLSWVACSTIPYALFNATLYILRSIGSATRAMVTNIVINASHLLFSIICLNILNLDIIGCSIALMAARIVGAGLGTVFLFFWRPPMTVKIRDLLVFESGLFRSVMQTSIPFSVDMTVSSVSAIIINAYMIPLGTTALATHSITNQLLTVLYCAPYAAVTLSQIVVGRCIGAGKDEEAYTYGRRCSQIYMIIQILSALLFFPLLDPLLRFYKASEVVSDTATQLLLYSLPGLIILYSICNPFTETLRSGGDSNYITAVSLSSLIVFNTALGYVFAIVLDIGLLGVWIATWISWLVRAILLYIRFRGRSWLRHQLIK